MNELVHDELVHEWIEFRMWRDVLNMETWR